MQTKLTLILNKKTINRAKRYAKKNKQSLSAIVENYFNLISEENKGSEENISPNVLELSGIIKLPEKMNIKKVYSKHIEEKYLDE